MNAGKLSFPSQNNIMLHDMKHHLLCNISYVGITVSMGIRDITRLLTDQLTSWPPTGHVWYQTGQGMWVWLLLPTQNMGFEELVLSVW